MEYPCSFNHFWDPGLNGHGHMMNRSLLTTLILFFCYCEILKCAVTIIPSFQKEQNNVFDENNFNLANGRSGEEQSSKACQRRFRAYSDVDFDERAACWKKTKLENVKYANFFEFLRYKVIESDVKLIETLEKSILGKQLNFPVVKLWLMLDKLMREPSISDNDALIEYTFLVVKLTENPADPFIIKISLEALKHAIRSHKPTIILRTLLKFLNGKLNEKELLTIFKIIYTSMNTETILTGNLSKDFASFAVALEELNPISWFQYIYNEGLEENEFPPYVILSPFYYLFSKADYSNDVKAVIEILSTCLFDVNKENMEILSKFIKLTDFCTCSNLDKQSCFESRSEIFKFALSRFEIEAEQYEKQLVSAIERHSLGLAEAFLFYTDCFLENSDYLCIAILNAIYASTTEIAVLIIAYRPISAEELIAMWWNTPDRVRTKFDSVRIGTIVELLKLSNEFDSDFADVVETVNDEGLTIHPFPEPEEYERIANNAVRAVSSAVLNNYWIARIILSKYFGISFHSTRIKGDFDSSPIWREVADAVNAFLLIRQSNHRVQCKVKGLNRRYI